MDMTMTMRSMMPPGLRAASSAIGSAMTSATIKASRTSSIVTDMRSEISVVTCWLLTEERPKLPTSAPVSQLMYRSWAGRSKPMRRRMASTSSSEASIPAWSRAGSPGIASRSTNTSTLIASSSGMEISTGRTMRRRRGEPATRPKNETRSSGCVAGLTVELLVTFDPSPVVVDCGVDSEGGDRRGQPGSVHAVAHDLRGGEGHSEGSVGLIGDVLGDLLVQARPLVGVDRSSRLGKQVVEFGAVAVGQGVGRAGGFLRQRGAAVGGCGTEADVDADSGGRVPRTSGLQHGLPFAGDEVGDDVAQRLGVDLDVDAGFAPLRLQCGSHLRGHAGVGGAEDDGQAADFVDDLLGLGRVVLAVALDRPGVEQPTGGGEGLAGFALALEQAFVD